ncbi:hypothetical protein [Salinibacter ruber]|uniref:hypothetical protein n=1 Tax=Salinibacter ruber TaxID=146919 RepID=UPI002073412B|nr:hypothetical protein [Salinibacter ruber]
MIEASTQYGDLSGTVAADRADPPNGNTFKALFQEGGLDYSKYFPVAYTFSMPEEKWNRDPGDADPMFVLIADCVRRDEVGSNMEDVRETIGPGEELPVHRFSMDITLSEFLRLFKRLEVTFPNNRGGMDPHFPGNVNPVTQDYHSLSREG